MSLDQPPPVSFDAMPSHQRSVVTALLVLFLGPIGAVFMWQFSRWSLSWKVLGTVYSVLYILVLLTAWQLATVTPAAAPVAQATPTLQATTVVIDVPTVVAVAPTSGATLPPEPTAPPLAAEPTPLAIDPTAAPPTLAPITAIPIDRATVPPTLAPIICPPQSHRESCRPGRRRPRLLHQWRRPGRRPP